MIFFKLPINDGLGPAGRTGGKNTSSRKTYNVIKCLIIEGKHYIHGELMDHNSNNDSV